MAQRVVLKGAELGFLVKRVKDKLYVYEYVKLPNGEKIERYIAPLEKLVRTYQAVQAGITVNHR